MKTNQILQRPMGNFKVAQRTKDGYFDANVLLSQWNENNTEKRISRFLESPKTKEFISVLDHELGSESHGANMHDGEYQAVIVSKGRNTKKGKTKDEVWLHPYLFIDFAMWLNPKFKYQVIKFVYDELIKYRKEAGNNYKEMCDAIKSITKQNESLVHNISKVAEALNYIAYGHHVKDIRNKEADESKLRELSDLQKDITKLINKKFIKTHSELMQYLKDEYKEKYFLL